MHRVPFVRRVLADGNLRELKSNPVSAPVLDEGGFKLAWMVPDGSAVKKGDPVVRFDPTELEKKLKDGQSDQASAAAKIAKEQTATGALLRDRDRTAKLSDAELDKTRKFQSKDTLIFSRNQIIESQVDEQLSGDRKTHAERAQVIESSLSKSKIDLLALERRKAEIAIERANKGLSGMEVRAAHDGIIVFEPDWAGNLPKVGDTVWSGQRLASLPLLDEMEVEAFVLEADAGGLAPGQPANVVLEADPDTGVQRQDQGGRQPRQAAGPRRSDQLLLGHPVARTDGPGEDEAGTARERHLDARRAGCPGGPSAGRLREGGAPRRVSSDGTSRRRPVHRSSALRAPAWWWWKRGSTRGTGSPSATPRARPEPARARTPHCGELPECTRSRPSAPRSNTSPPISSARA